MKTLMKLAVVAILVTFAAPAMAASPTKGTKSYQTAKSEAEQQQQAANEQPADPSKIEPAAGDTAEAHAPKADATSDEGKSFAEEIRLPRKN